ncbi:hypothetical protein EJ110_NYTH46793 [Nymphaea thermarum]|nr:hypothetical protein EJ110_NYTH46793 [Nymphaea thermarum]
MPERDVIIWNSIISAYRRCGFVEAALELYIGMNRGGIKGNTSTLSSVIGACNDAGSVGLGYQVHCRSMLLGLDDAESLTIEVVGAQGARVAGYTKLFRLVFRQFYVLALESISSFRSYNQNHHTFVYLPGHRAG